MKELSLHDTNIENGDEAQALGVKLVEIVLSQHHHKNLLVKHRPHWIKQLESMKRFINKE